MQSHVAQMLDEELARRGLRLERSGADTGIRFYDIVAPNSAIQRGSFAVVDNLQDMHSTCKAAYRELSQRFPGEVKGVSSMTSATLDDDLRGQKPGIGRLMYSRIAEDLAEQGLALVPDNCGMGSTSPAAMNVWGSLAKRYPSQRYVYKRGPSTVAGYVVFGKGES